MADERDPRAERFERYLAGLMGGSRPSPRDVDGDAEAEMARLAAEMSAASGGSEAEPDPAFIEQLRLRMRAADEGLNAVLVTPPVRESRTVPPAQTQWSVSRRQVLQAGIGAAAGLAAGVLGTSLASRSSQRQAIGGEDELISGEGFWQEVARLTDVPAGSAVRFSTVAFDGFIVNDGREVRALSSVCSHMGCTLHFRPEWQDLRCPCHDASFDLTGRLANGRRAWREAPYRGDAKAYAIELPDLVRPRVKIDEDRILVWTAQA